MAIYDATWVRASARERPRPCRLPFAAFAGEIERCARARGRAARGHREPADPAARGHRFDFRGQSTYARAYCADDNKY